MPFIEKHVGIVFCVALLLGLMAPVPWKDITSLLMPLMIFLLFLSFLGVDASHLRTDLRRPGHLITQIILQFVLLPVGLFLVVRAAGFPNFATAVFLLACMPAGLGSPVFTAIANGRVATSVVLSVVTHAIVPVTVPLLFWMFSGTHVAVNVAGMAQKLAILVGTAAVLAYLCRHFASGTVARTKPYRKLMSILALAGVAYVVIVPYADTIRHDVVSVLPVLAGTYLFFGVLCVCSFLLSKKSAPQEQIAIIISRMYMNNALGIVLAVQFFNKDVALISILSEIPWFTTFGAYLWFQRRFISK